MAKKSLRLTPQSFNGFLFQQGKRVASDFVNAHDWSIRGLSTQNTPRHENFPKFSEKLLEGSVKVVNVNLNDLDADRDSLVTAMDIKGPTQHPLYGLDKLGRLWSCMVTAVGLNTQAIDENTGSFGYIFETDDPTWTMVEATTDIWYITANGDQHTVTVEGNQDVNPEFLISPTTTPVGYYPYKDYIKNYNPIASTQVDGVDITPANWNHAALVAAGKSLANGDDVLVFMDGAIIPRWIGGGGWNSTTAKLFIRQTWKPGQYMALRTAIAGAGTPTLIQWEQSARVRAALAKLPPRGIIRVGTEEISYKSLQVGLCQATVVERPIRGTTIAAHSVGDVCWWVEHDIKVVYGNLSAPVPVYSDVFKPVFDLATSTITSRVYTSFADTDGRRAGAWKRLVRDDGIGKLNRVYSGNQASQTEVNPATDMGMEIAAYQAQGRWRPETAWLEWSLYHPAGITVVTSAGEKWKAYAGTLWPARAELCSSADGVKYLQEWNESTPASAATWTPWTHNNEAMPAGTRFAIFRFMGSINANIDNLVRLEVDSATVTLDSANVIQCGMNGEISSYHFTIQIENLTTDESLFLDYPVTEDRTLTIDTEDYEATYRGMNVIRAITLDAIRTFWLKFVPGPNVLRYTVTSVTGNVTLTSIYHNKSL